MANSAFSERFGCYRANGSIEINEGVVDFTAEKGVTMAQIVLVGLPQHNAVDVPIVRTTSVGTSRASSKRSKSNSPRATAST